jgi:hypothetical protein
MVFWPGLIVLRIKGVKGGKIMNQQFGMAKQMIEMQKTSCESIINSMIIMWEQSGNMLEGATWFPEEGRKAFRQWVEVNKKACENMKSAISSGYANLEKFFSTVSP